MKCIRAALGLPGRRRPGHLLSLVLQGRGEGRPQAGRGVDKPVREAVLEHELLGECALLCAAVHEPALVPFLSVPDHSGSSSPCA